MVFDINNKVALVTGGASGIGLEYIKELLRNGVKGVTIADVNPTFGTNALEDIKSEFGPNKAILVKTDVTSIQEFEIAFLETIRQFTNVDISINNAGILNDAIWEKEILINLNGTVHGMLLEMDKYLPIYKQGYDALIMNVASTAATQAYPSVPVYVATKHGVLGLTKSWGIPEFYDETKVRVVAICPGVTATPLIANAVNANLGGRYEIYAHKELDRWPQQEPEFVAKEATKVIKYAPNGTSWIIEGGEPVYEYAIPDRSTMTKNILNTN